MSKRTFILISEAVRRHVIEQIMAAPVDAVVELKPPRRTIPQNDKMWAMLTEISEAKPEGRMMTPDLWKAVLMHACGHEVQFIAGIDGSSPFPVGFKSSKLSKEEMGYLITFMIEYGERHGVIFKDTPAPEDPFPEPEQGYYDAQGDHLD